MKQKCSWIEKAKFTDPDYGNDVTEDVRDVLRRTYSANIIGGNCNGELIRVMVSYVTRRGNVRNPIKYLLLQKCPEDEKKLRDVVNRVIDAEYTIKNVNNPYRAVKNVTVQQIERYAVVTM